jgi:hypothetical protein
MKDKDKEITPVSYLMWVLLGLALLVALFQYFL